MFTLEVRYSGRWKWGVRTYNTLEDAERRVKELASIGIRSRIRKASDLWEGCFFAPAGFRLVTKRIRMEVVKCLKGV